MLSTPPEPSPPVSGAPAAGPWRAAWRTVGPWLVGLLLFVPSVLLAAWLALHWGILPRLEGWRPQIEERASRALGVPVRIGGIEVQTGEWIPVIDLHQVELLGPQGEVALQLPHVRAALSPQSLLGWTPRFAQLFLDGPVLDIHRDGLGRLRIGGLDLSAAQGLGGAGTDERGGAGPVADWFFRQSEFVVRNGRLRWTDEQRLAPAVELHGVTLVVRNSLRRHDFRLDASPSSEWGDRFSLRGRFTQELLAAPSDWRRWSGQLHADLPRADLQALRRHVTLPVDVQEGDGAVRVWAELRTGSVVEVGADLALREVSVRLAPRLEPLRLRDLTTRMSARRDPDRLKIELKALAFDAGDGEAATRWPATDLSLDLRQQQAGGLMLPSSAPVTGGAFQAERLDIGLLAALAERLPLGEALHRSLAALAPQGVISRLEGRWEGEIDAPARYQVTLRGDALALQAGDSADTRPPPTPGALGRPGFRGGAVELQADERGGKALLSLRNGSLRLPGLFDEPELPFRELHAPLTWTVEPQPGGAPPRLKVSAQDVRFTNADASGSLSGHWTSGSGQGLGPAGRFPGTLDLQARIDQARAARVARYLPQGLPAATRHYLTDAITAGEVSRGSIRVRGALWDFPWLRPGEHATGRPAGEFRVAARIDGARFAFVPSTPARLGEAAWTSPWPALDAVSGDLLIERGALSLNGARARVGALVVSDTSVRIPDLERDPRVLVQGRAAGPAADWLEFVSRTPVRDWTRGALDGWRAGGELGLTLGLDLPLHQMASSLVQGQVELRGGDLWIGHGIPPLTQARGRVEFTESGFRLQQVAARGLGGEAQAEGGLDRDGLVRLRVQGQASADGLRRAGELGFIARLGASLSGSAPYQVQFEAGAGGRSLVVSSSLLGLASELPEPLRKEAATALPLRVQLVSRPVESAGADGAAAVEGLERDQLRVDLGSVVQARYSREWSGTTLRAVRGNLRVGAGAGSGESPVAGDAGGVVAQVRLPGADLDLWRPLLDRVFTPPEASAGGGAVTAPVSASGAASSTASSTATANAVGFGPDGAALHAPTEVHLVADWAQLWGRRLHAVDATWRPRSDGWRASLQSREAEGSVEWLEQGDSGLLRSRLRRLDIVRPPALPPGLGEPAPGGAVHAAPSLGVGTAQRPPALDVLVDELRWEGRRIGRLELEASTRPGPRRATAPDWRVSRLSLTMPDGTLQAQSPARTAVDGRTAGGALDFRLDIADTGRLLERVLEQRSIRGGRGAVQGSVQWNGSPLWPDFASLGGRLSLALESGQFLRVEPGAGRLLGVLSLQALPRRLALDFRDVFQEGFAFDSITGDVAIDAGMARTTNLSMRGVQAAVLMEGQADLQRETQDLRVVVVPEINAGTASIAYAAINPAVGVGTFLAQLFLRRPLAAAGTREFHVTGSWADPQVARIERSRLGAPAESSAEGSPAEPLPPYPGPGPGPSAAALPGAPTAPGPLGGPGSLSSPPTVAPVPGGSGAGRMAP